MIRFLLLQTLLNFMNAGQKRALLKIKKKKNNGGGSLYHRNLPVTFEFASSSFFHISRGILVWYGNSVNHPLQLQQIAISFAATSKQYSGKCTFRESNIARSLYIYIYVHICQYTLFLFIWRDIFRALTSESPDV